MMRKLGDFGGLYNNDGMPSTLSLTDVQELRGDRESGINVLTKSGVNYFYSSGLFHKYSLDNGSSNISFDRINEVFMINSCDIYIGYTDGSSFTIQEYSFYMYNILG